MEAFAVLASSVLYTSVLLRSLRFWLSVLVEVPMCFHLPDVPDYNKQLHFNMS